MNKLKNDAATKRVTTSCIEHLTTEVEILQEYMRYTNAIYESFGQAQPVQDEKTEEWQLSMDDRARQQEKNRQELRNVMASAMGVPVQQATVRTFIDVLPEDNDDVQQIKKLRKQLLNLESELQSLNRTNSLLIRQSVDLFQRIALEMTDQKPAIPTYSPSGELTDSGSSTFMQTDC